MATARSCRARTTRYHLHVSHVPSRKEARMRLYLLQLGMLPDLGNSPIPGYLIQTDDGKNVLIDTGYPRTLRGRQAKAADEMVAAHPDDQEVAFSAMIVRAVRDDPADAVTNRLAEIGLAPGDIDI